MFRNEYGGHCKIVHGAICPSVMAGNRKMRWEVGDKPVKREKEERKIEEKRVLAKIMTEKGMLCWKIEITHTHIYIYIYIYIGENKKKRDGERRVVG